MNLPTIMICHIARTANTTQKHDLGYGFVVTLVFEHFGVVLQKKMGVQMVEEIASSTLMGCDFTLVKGEQTTTEQGPRTPFSPIPGTSSNEPSI